MSIEARQQGITHNVGRIGEEAEFEKRQLNNFQLLN